MKKQLFMALLAIAAWANANAQQTKETGTRPTAAAKSAFNQKFPGVTNVSWEKEGADLEVNFKKNGQEMSAVFSPGGEWKETETEIPFNALPNGAKDYLNKINAGQKVAETAKIEKANGTVNYEAEVGKKDLLFDANGKLLK